MNSVMRAGAFTGLLIVLSSAVAFSPWAQAAPAPGPDHQRILEWARAVPAAPQTVKVAERVDDRIEMLSSDGTALKDWVIHEPGASFIKVHFADFRLPRGVTVEVSDPHGVEVYRYGSGRESDFTVDVREGDNGRTSFSAMSITGDTAIIRVTGNTPGKSTGKSAAINALKHRVLIDHYMVGYPEGELATNATSGLDAYSSVEASGSKSKNVLESTCGSSDREHAVCYESSHPEEFDSSWPVAKIIIGGGVACTAWRVGPDNHLLTNHHCIENQDLVAATEVWFDYQRLRCKYSELATPVKVSGATLLATSNSLDYTLFTVSNFPAIEPYGYLGLDVQEAGLGDRIYIPQHAGGNPKQLAIESDMNLSGMCEIDSETEDGNVSGSDYGYYCDTWGGSSGSPVISAASGRAVALHHHGGCFNSGVKMSLIWPEIQGFFGGVVPGDEGPSSSSPPIAEFVAACDGLACAFDASQSSDPDGSIVSYLWNFGDGLTGTGLAPSHSYAASGQYSVTLTIEDGDGLTAQTIEAVSVTDDNDAPIAAFSVSCDALECAFDAGSSYDTDGVISQYAWDFGDGASVTEGDASTTHTYPGSGSYTVRLTVVDDRGGAGSASTTLSVEGLAVAPEASFAVSCDSLSCSFDGSQSSDSDGMIVSYEWTFGDGSVVQGSSAAVTHEYAVDGQYLVTLKVTDDDALTGSASQSIDIVQVSVNQPPTANFTFECAALTCTFDGSSSTDPDGVITEYEWQFGDGSAPAYGSIVNHTFPAGGTYEVTLTISDNVEASHQTNQVVEVAPATTNAITLQASGTKFRGTQTATLNWNGASTSKVEIWRGTDLIETTANDGSYVDSPVHNSIKFATYRVCDIGSGNCSNEETINF